MVLAGSPIRQLSDLRAPMTTVLDTLAERLAQLKRYEELYGPLPDEAKPQQPARPPAPPRQMAFIKAPNDDDGAAVPESGSASGVSTPVSSSP